MTPKIKIIIIMWAIIRIRGLSQDQLYTSNSQQNFISRQVQRPRWFTSWKHSRLSQIFSAVDILTKLPQKLVHVMLRQKKQNDEELFHIPKYSRDKYEAICDTGSDLFKFVLLLVDLQPIKSWWSHIFISFFLLASCLFNKWCHNEMRMY